MEPQVVELPIEIFEESIKKLERALEATRDLMRISPYACLCGAGLTRAENCEYCQAYSRAAAALQAAGYPV